LTIQIATEDSVVKILIDKSLADRLQTRIESSEFKSISDYAVFVLSQIVDQLDSKNGSQGE